MSMRAACDRYGRTKNVRKVRIQVSVINEVVENHEADVDLYLETKDLCKEGRENLIAAIKRYTSPPVRRKAKPDADRT